MGLVNGVRHDMLARRTLSSRFSGMDPPLTLKRSSTNTVVLLAKFDNPGRGKRPLFAGTDNRLFIGGGNLLRRLLYRANELEAEVCRRIGRGLSEKEVLAFFPNEPPANPCKKNSQQ